MKKRLDTILVERNLVESKHKAQALIMAGAVFVNNIRVDKPGKKFSEDIEIYLKELPKFVSRGGLKLEHAINYFKIDVNEKICMDVGASTGGFTDCLLKYGAKKVYSIDVGYGQLHYSLRRNPSVVNIERCNFRYIDKEVISDKIDVCTIDVSFISLKKIIPKALEFLDKSGEIIALVKPQFEVGKDEVEKGGVVKDPVKHIKVIDSMIQFCELELKLECKGFTESPILGQKGNKEFLLFFKNRS